MRPLKELVDSRAAALLEASASRSADRVAAVAKESMKNMVDCLYENEDYGTLAYRLLLLQVCKYFVGIKKMPDLVPE